MLNLVREHHSTPQRVSDAAEDEILYLLGRPQMGEDLGFLCTQVLDPPDTRAIADAWRDANSIIRELQTSEKGWVEDTTLEDLHPGVREARDRLLRDPAFEQAFSVIPVDIKMVEIDRLVVPQKQINLNNVASIQAGIGADPDPLSLFNLCMAQEHPRADIRCVRASNESFVFVSPSHDLRLLDALLLEPGQIQGTHVRGVVGSALGLMIGYSFNCMTVAYVQNRLVLTNGTHRALALRQLGVTHVPCLVQSVTRPEELPVVMPREFMRNPGEFLGIARPSVMKDYLDPRLVHTAHVTRCARQVRITFSVEVIDAPVAG